MALPSGADPRTGQRAPTQGPALSNAIVFLPWCLVFSLSWLAVSGLPWFQVAASPVPPLRVTFQLPAGGTSGQVSFLFFSGDVPRTVLEPRGNPVTSWETKPSRASVEAHEEVALRVSVEAPLRAGVESPLRLVSPVALHKAGKGTDPRTGFFRYPLLRGTFLPEVRLRRTLAWWFSSCSSPSFSSSLCWACLFLLLTDRRELDVSIASLVFHVEGVHEWLQLVAIETAVDGTDIVASTSSLWST